MKSIFQAERCRFGSFKLSAQQPKYVWLRSQATSRMHRSDGRWRPDSQPMTLAVRTLLLLAACCGLTGCFGFLKPAHSTARHFLLTPLPTTNPASLSIRLLSVGVGRVKIPAYLFDTSLAVRKGTNEVSYLPSVLWAERLDVGLQRVLAANLAVLLPADQVRLSAWRSEDVSAEVYVQIQQFDVDTLGRCVLVAWWRILAPGGEKTLQTGESRLTRQGPLPDSDPAGSIATLSELASDCSAQLAQAIKNLRLTHNAAAPIDNLRASQSSVTP